MGLFGRKPRMVGFGDPEAQKKAAPKRGRFNGQHTGQDHRRADTEQSGHGPWSSPATPLGRRDLQMQIDELKKRSPAIGTVIEKLAGKGPAGLSSVATDISRILWRVMWIFIVLFFVLPILAGIVTAFFPGHSG